jgi:hypothetical protein
MRLTVHDELSGRSLDVLEPFEVVPQGEETR